jgi:hypothetical protein
MRMRLIAAVPGHFQFHYFQLQMPPDLQGQV